MIPQDQPRGPTYDGLRVLLQLGLIIGPVRLLQQVRQEALEGERALLAVPIPGCPRGDAPLAGTQLSPPHAHSPP